MATAPRSLRPNANAAINVLLVDDSAVIRGMLRRWLEESDIIRVAGTAADGQAAIREAQSLKPDIIILDIEMPVMDGITALPKLKAAVPDCHIIMASTLTTRNADISLQAMRLGATDYIPKPESRVEMTGGTSFKDAIIEKVVALGNARRQRQGKPALGVAPTPPSPRPLNVAPLKAAPRPRQSAGPAQIIAIGSSTGGPQALFKFLEGLPASFQTPIVITQHMPPTFTEILAGHLKKVSGRDCREAKNGDHIRRGQVYVAPGGKHMLLKGSAGDPVIELDDGPEENFCKPAVDPMFRSVASLFGNRALCVVLTGMGSDGCKGAAEMRKTGAPVLVQDEATSTVWGMPGAVSKAGLADQTIPIGRMADAVMRAAKSE
ncbi:MAG: chemotaxis response regulator protein-glutamate methylesterase [Pseudomonadota bacterium]